MQDVLRELEAVAQPTVDEGSSGLAERNQDFHRLLEREQLVSQLSYLDASGKERVRTSPLETRPDRQRHRPLADAAFLGARADERYFGPVYFQRGSQPHMTISVAETRPGRGVVVAEIDLRFVGQVIDRARVGTAGYAYAVDSRGELVTHPDINLVLRHTNFALAAAGAGRAARAVERPTDAATIGRDQDGTKVLSAFQTIESLGWRVFVEEPLSEAFAPLESAIWRTALLLVAFLAPGDRHRASCSRAGSSGRSSRSRPPRRGSAPARSTSGSRSRATTSWGRSPRSSTAWPRGSRSPTRASSRRSRSAPASSRRRSASSTRRAASSRPRAGTSRSSWRTCRTSCGRR